MQPSSKVQLVLCCTILAWALCTSPAAAGGISTRQDGPVHKVANRRALHSSASWDKLYAQLEAAASAGDLAHAQSVRRQLLVASKHQHKHRRSLLQDDCGTLPGLQGCAAFDCRNTNKLAKTANGTVECKYTAPSPPGVDVGEFKYFLVYDYSNAWDTNTDNVLAAASRIDETNVNTNLLESKVGQVGSSSSVEYSGRTRAIPNPFLGIKDDDAFTANLWKAETSVSADPLQQATIIDTTNSGFETSSTTGAYLPGTVATVRPVKDKGGSEDNVVLTKPNAALLTGFVFGKK